MRRRRGTGTEGSSCWGRWRCWRTGVDLLRQNQVFVKCIIFFNRTVVEAGFERVASSSGLPIKEKEAVYDSEDYLPVVLQV